MIHVDVRRQAQQHGGDPYVILVQTSVDGSDWKTQYTLEVSAYNNLKHCEDEATFLARVFANGCRFAGAEVRSTAFGYNN